MSQNAKTHWEAIAADFHAGAIIKELVVKYGYSAGHTRKILADQGIHIGPRVASDPLFPQRAMIAAAKASSLSLADLKGPSRKRKNVLARYAVMLAMHKRGVPSPAIGRRFGRDHSTVLYGVKKAQDYIKCWPDFARLCEMVDAA